MTQRDHWLDHRLPPPLLAALLAVGMVWSASFGPAWTLPPALRVAGAMLIAVAGIAFDLLGLRAFRALRTTINPLRPCKASALATDGIYRVTRNPMYVGLALLLLALAVWLCALWPLLGPVCFVLYIDRFQIAPEEAALRRNFGDDFERYAARVRRWL